MDNNELYFSLFYDTERGINNTSPRKEINLEQLFKIYKSDRIKQLTLELQKAPPQARQSIKLQLPFFTPYGTFEKRNNASIKQFNKKLVALDFDGLDRPNAEKLKRKLTYQSCVILAAISPRGNGVKALILCDGHKTTESNYNTLKLNANELCARLGIHEYKDSCDRAQFVLCQPMFIAYDPQLYTNSSATPLQLEYKEYQPPQIEQQPRTIVAPSFVNSRIDRYLLNASNKLYNELIRTPEGNRHHSIIKVQKIASWLHYAPHLEHEIKNNLLTAVISMYGSERNAELNNAQKSFAEAWRRAPINTNPTIETIINELNTATI
jgi:hypothetical protein